MMPRHLFVLTALAHLAAPLAAETEASPGSVAAWQETNASTSQPNDPFSHFTPNTGGQDQRLDYSIWDEALQRMVIPMGPSLRQTPGTVEPRLGTRRVHGHTSRYRMEGNRIAFSFLTPEFRAAVSEYREDLERIGSELDLTSMPRNEQLAFWLNLHNVAMIEAVTNEYPTRQIAGDLDEVKLVTIDGIALSPRDIREKIVFPNWEDPKVIYGFWRGAIGGPSIQRLAFNGGNVDALLSLSGEEFVNSLRGVERWSGKLQLSPIYEEAVGFYFSDNEKLRTHLAQYGREDLQRLIDRSQDIAFKEWERDIADLQLGFADPSLSPLCSTSGEAIRAGNKRQTETSCSRVDSRPNFAIQRLLEERANKLKLARRRGIRTGQVIYGDTDYDPEQTVEVQ